MSLCRNRRGSLFKRSVMGAFHKVGLRISDEELLKHMDRYLEELEWRFNNRDNPLIFRPHLLLRILAKTPLFRYRINA